MSELSPSEQVDLIAGRDFAAAPAFLVRQQLQALPSFLLALAIGSDRPEGGDGVLADDEWWGS
jgi:hypothetical protein